MRRKVNDIRELTQIILNKNVFLGIKYRMIMVTAAQLIACIEEFAPLRLQEDFDNSGLLVGQPDRPVHGALLAVDLTEQVMEEALATHCDMIITHHPLIFRGLKHLCGETAVERCVAAAVRNDLTVYACHTNIDNVRHGVSWKMAEKLHIEDLRILQPRPDCPDAGLGVIGALPVPVRSDAFIRQVRQQFHTPCIRCTTPPDTVQRIALCGGSGGDLWTAAVRSGADVLITADVRYHQFLDAEQRIWLMDIGHYESEQYTKEIFYAIISEKFPTFAVHFSKVNTNPIKYL